MGRRGLLLQLSTLCLLALASCGGGGGGGGTPTQPPPAANVVFTADSPAGTNSISLRQSGSSGSGLVLEVVATGVEELYGVSFDLLYPAVLLRFEGVSEGSWLSEAGAVQTSLQVADDGGGNLIVGLTRLGDVDGRNGTGVLMTLRFARVGVGTGTIAFDREQAVNRRGASQPGVVWIGGRVQSSG